MSAAMSMLLVQELAENQRYLIDETRSEYDLYSGVLFLSFDCPELDRVYEARWNDQDRVITELVWWTSDYPWELRHGPIPPREERDLWEWFDGHDDVASELARLLEAALKHEDPR